MLRQKNQKFKAIFIVIDFFLSIISVGNASWLYFYMIAPEKRRHVVPSFDYINEDIGFLITYLYLAILFSICQIIIFERIQLYQKIFYLKWKKEFGTILKGVSINLVITLAIIFFYRDASYSRATILITPFLTIFYISIGHQFLRFFILMLNKKRKDLKNVIIIGTTKVSTELLQNIQRQKIFRMKVVAVLGKKPSQEKELLPFYKGNLKQLKRIISKTNTSIVLYAEELESKKIEEVMLTCDQAGIYFYIIPPLNKYISNNSRIEEIGSISFIPIRETPLYNIVNLFNKRLFDIVFSSVTLLLLSPIFLLISILIFIESKGKGSIFFSQKRMGIDQTIFKVWKFRSMKVQDKQSSEQTWGKKKDDRVTKIGAFLRKTSLDEFPQLWNVLQGSMSIVGPRPERPYFIHKFSKQYKQYMRRHLVKSGITGWAQIQGLRGDTSIKKRVEADIYYIENWSFTLDIYILLKTPLALVRNPGE